MSDQRGLFGSDARPASIAEVGFLGACDRCRMIPCTCKPEPQPFRRALEGLSEEDAMRALQKQARDSRRQMAEVAKEILDPRAAGDADAGGERRR